MTSKMIKVRNAFPDLTIQVDGGLNL